EGILLAATLGFDLHRETYEGMCASARALDLVEGTLRREVFCEILIAPHGGKGMRMLAGADLMPAIIGELAMKLNRRQREQFSSLCDNIDKTKPVLSRRLGLFYTAFEGKKGEAAMAHLGYEAELEQHILDGLRLMDKLHFLRTPLELKDFLAKVGRERYDYLDNLAKAQRMVYDTSEMKILARKAYMEQLLASREPIFVSDLCVDKQTLLREGLPEEEVEKILLMLTDIVHRKPKENTEVALINYAKKLSKNKFFAKTRKVKWLR
ncbi:MAG: hypothetical protein RR626_05505, partial [Anaerovoracaceae bacterium]